MAETLGALLANYARNRAMWRPDGTYQKGIWDDIEGIFIELQEALVQPNRVMDALCNIMAQDQDMRRQRPMVKLICKHIIRIIFFAEGISFKDGHMEVKKDSAQDGDLRDYLRCMVGHVAAITLYSGSCKTKETVRKIIHTVRMWGGEEGNIGKEQQCARLDYDTLQIGSKFFAKTMGDWIRRWGTRNGGQIRGRAVESSCDIGNHSNTSKDREQEGSEEPIVKMFQDNTADDVRDMITRGEKIEDENRQKIMKELKEQGIAGDEWTTLMATIGATAPKPAPAKPATTITVPAATKGSTAGKQPGATPPKVPEVPAAVVPENKPSEGGAGTGAGTGSTGGGEDTSKKDGGKNAVSRENPTCVKTMEDTKVHKTWDGNHLVSVGISFADYSSPGCSGSGTPGSGPSEQTTTQDTQDTVSDKGPASGPPAAAAPKAGAEPEPATKTGISNGAVAATPTSPDPASKAAGKQEPDSMLYFPNVRNPPPWYKELDEVGKGVQPKTENSVSSGTGSTGNQNPGSSFTAAFDFDPTHITPPGIGNVAGGIAPPTLKEKDYSSPPDNRGEKPGDYAVPDLTNTVLTATTPVLFFLSALTVALLGYSLWKYFAYLAKRRRTYRTVRDVPSPPLDEEIWQHLQRGDLPPPDYGYTMIKDRPPASTSARRRRHPRVHTRTIIELHLEVLNECEAPEWENAKDDYLQIVVEEFARDLQQDEETNNNILGVSTSHAALASHDSTTDHSTSHTRLTRDPTETDACPPHDPDAWSCMETRQLATDRCPPNEEDPDPWSCMESIQLATDPCAPNEDDRWKCMETMQLATHPCPPNEEDRWSCMETMQLATDHCPPTEDNPDRCSSMQHIQLATDPCLPNEDEPWSCMETMQLEQEDTPSSLAYSSHPGNECPIRDHTNWINWIDRSKHILRECTTQPWFLQLKAHWKQYLSEHMAVNAASGEHRTAATMETQKLEAWKAWVAQQHRQMSTYSEQQCFQYLLRNIEEENTLHGQRVRGANKETVQAPIISGLNTEDTHLMPEVPHEEHIPSTTVKQREQQDLYPDIYRTKSLTANTWILILALVIEQCEVECRLQDTELYVDDLLQTC
ncbi:hypothetical protein AK88_05520 [Plasmodium fragile]|uniref:Schizont-infected cell agglutination C-terminal domain-containing protein n=1 Tax=Plasmodium fragile TaxID=5857 RepID=A0A0D9QCR8_PLAFR|nr:uncharacterized protein AK88_05520 [Plasmodium fragile]KJP84850.1 hypothetical protein AK88_05520 [Plasmodium fragile]